VSQVSCELMPANLRSPFHFCRWSHRRAAFGNNRYVNSSQELEEQVIMLGINPPVVSHLLCYCLRSVVDSCRCIFHCLLRFCRWSHGRTAFGNNRYVNSRQEPEEQVLMLGINPPVVSHLLCYCLRSVVDSCRQIVGRLHVSCSGITGEQPVGITGM